MVTASPLLMGSNRGVFFVALERQGLALRARSETFAFFFTFNIGKGEKKSLSDRKTGFSQKEEVCAKRYCAKRDLGFSQTATVAIAYHF